VEGVFAHAGHVCFSRPLVGVLIQTADRFFIALQPHTSTMQNFILLTLHTTYPLAPPVEIYSVDAARYDASGRFVTCIDAFEGLMPDDLKEITAFFGDPAETVLVAENPDEDQKLLTAAFHKANLSPPTHKMLNPRQFGVPLEWFPRFLEENPEQVLAALQNYSSR